jgi:Trypsin-like peptidase domain
MYEQAITKISRSIFPVFYKLRVDGITTIGISGTAFFINDVGHFITATHVTTDVPSGAKLLYAGNLPHTSLDRPIEIEEVYRNDLKYIYIGKVPKFPLPGLKFTGETSSPGKSVCLSGYPLTELLINHDESVNLSNIRQYWKPTMVIDSIEAAINHGTQTGFITEHSSLNGMSGGPVFDSDGDVCGIDVTTFLREIPEPYGGKSFVRNGVVIGTINMRDLIPESIPLV